MLQTKWRERAHGYGIIWGRNKWRSRIQRRRKFKRENRKREARPSLQKWPRRGYGTWRNLFSQAPTVWNYGISKSTSSSSTSIQNKAALPKCETSLKFTITVGISGFISGGAGFLSFGYQFDTTFGQCKIPRGCSFINPIKGTSAGAAYGMGTGMCISVYGRAGVDGKLEIA